MKSLVIVLIIFIAYFIFLFVRKGIGNMRLYNILALLKDGKFEEADKIISSTSTRLLVSPYSILQAQLQSAILQDHTDDVTSFLDRSGQLKMTPSQKKDVYMEAFNYYVSKNDRGNSQKCLRMIDSLMKMDDVKTTAHMIFDVMIEGKKDKLNELLKRADETAGQEQMSCEFMVSKIYNELGEKVLSQKYLKRAQDHYKVYSTQNRQK